MDAEADRPYRRHRTSPDIAVLRRGAVSYKERDACGEDTLLLIEVADTSLAYDRSTKLRLYAEAGIPEYWVVDCSAEAIEIYPTPAPRGYRDSPPVAAPAPPGLQAFPTAGLPPRT